IAPPLILVAVIRALMTANVRGRLAGKLFFLLILNTLVAILIGLLVANLLRPGTLRDKRSAALHGETLKMPPTKWLDTIPDSVLRPLVDNNVIGVILIAVAIGLAARKLPPERSKLVLAA